MEDKILAVVSKVSKKSVEELKDHLDATKLWDSFAHVEMIVELENQLNVFFDEDEIAQMKTPAKVIEFAKKKAAH